MSSVAHGTLARATIVIRTPQSPLRANSNDTSSRAPFRAPASSFAPSHRRPERTRGRERRLRIGASALPNDIYTAFAARATSVERCPRARAVREIMHACIACTTVRDRRRRRRRRRRQHETIAMGHRPVSTRARSREKNIDTQSRHATDACAQRGHTSHRGFFVHRVRRAGAQRQRRTSFRLRLSLYRVVRISSSACGFCCATDGVFLCVNSSRRDTNGSQLMNIIRE